MFILRQILPYLLIIIVAIMAILSSVLRFSPEEKIKMEQTRRINGTELELSDDKNTIKYMKDIKTGLCFATVWSRDFGGSVIVSFTYVPCELLLKSNNHTD